ncbi:MAG TPA: hypothetical protein VI968_00050 [archaeon]|nr:hypothetical protein [archaeon]
MLRPRKLTLEVFIALLFGVTALHAVLTVSRSLTSYTANIGFPFSFYTQNCSGLSCINSFNALSLIPDVIIFYVIAVVLNTLYRGMKHGSYKTHTFSLPKIPRRRAKHNEEEKEHEMNKERSEKEQNKKNEEPATEPKSKPEYESDEEPLFDKDEAGSEDETGDKKEADDDSQKT